MLLVQSRRNLTNEGFVTPTEPLKSLEKKGSHTHTLTKNKEHPRKENKEIPKNKERKDRA